MFSPDFDRFQAETVSLFKPEEDLPFYPNHLWQIESGLVKIITHSDNGNLIVLGLWGKGDIVGNFFGKIEPYHIICITKIKASLIAFGELPELAEIIFNHLEQMQELELIRRYKSVDIMLVKLLTWFGEKFGKKTDQGTLIDLRLSPQDLADILGSNLITITKCLNQLEKQGVIKKLSLMIIILKEDQFWSYEI